MWGSALAIKWGAEKHPVALNDGKGQNNNIAVFPSYVAGICAQLDLWRTSPKYRNKRFADAIATWSGHNEVESYIAFVSERVPGLTRDTVMDDAFWRSPSGVAFLKAQAWHEAGQEYPAPDGDWLTAQHLVFGHAAHTPAAPSTVPDVKPMTTSKIGNGQIAIGAGTAIEIGSKVNDAITQANAAKQGAKDLGVFDVLGPLVAMPTFWIAVAVIVIASFAWYWRRQHAQAGV